MKLTTDEKKLVYEFRNSLVSTAKALPKFLLSVDWAKLEQVGEAYRLLPLWKKPTPIQALQVSELNVSHL